MFIYDFFYVVSLVFCFSKVFIDLILQHTMIVCCTAPFCTEDGKYLHFSYHVFCLKMPLRFVLFLLHSMWHLSKEPFTGEAPKAETVSRNELLCEIAIPFFEVL